MFTHSALAYAGQPKISSSIQCDGLFGQWQTLERAYSPSGEVPEPETQQGQDECFGMLDTQLKSDLRQLAVDYVKRASATLLQSDPMLGPDSALVSVGAKLQRQHGNALPIALALVLERHGLTVLQEQELAISATSWDLADNMTIQELKSVKRSRAMSVELYYKADLVVISSTEGWMTVLDGKRGCGRSDASSKEALARRLKGVFCDVLHWAHANEHSIVSRDVRILDFYGNSGYSDDMKINGFDLDAYFGLDIEAAMAWFNRCFFEATAKLRALMGSASAVDESTTDHLAAMDFGFQSDVDDKIVDLFAEPTSGGDGIARFSDSLVAARTRFQAAAA